VGQHLEQRAPQRKSARAVQTEPIENVVARAREATEKRRALQRAAKLERDAAKALGGRRTAKIGARGSRPDVSAIRLACGVVLIPEAKARKRLPRVITDALDQARRYAPGCEPLAVLRELGGRALVVLELHAFARIAGVESEVLTSRRPTSTARDARQLSLLEEPLR
jgi:hypothetical protein